MPETTQIQIHTDSYAIAAFIGYLLLVIGIGIYATRFYSTGVSELLLAIIKARKKNRAFFCSANLNIKLLNQDKSKRSRFITLFHANTKSFTNFSFESALP